MARAVIDGARISGLAEFRSELKELDKRWPRELRKANNKAAEVAAGSVRSAVSGGTKQQASLAETVRAQSTQLQAKLAIGNNARKPYAIPAFMGSRSRSGWYADPKYAGSSGRQFLPWVGNQWDPGDSLDGPASGEPYVVGGAIRSVRGEFLDAYMEAIDDVYKEAFPSPGGRTDRG